MHQRGRHGFCSGGPYPIVCGGRQEARTSTEMDFWGTLLDVVLLLAAAIVLGLLAERLRQSAVIGYLAAGMLLGPSALHMIDSQKEVVAIAELGVAILLFTIGLEFSLTRLRRIGRVALWGGTLQVVATLLLVGGACLALGIAPREAVALGAICALSSTACVMRVLVDRAELDAMHGRGALGILLLQDVAVVPLVLLVTTLGREGSAIEIAAGLGRTLGLAVLLIVGFVGVTNLLLPRLLTAAALSKNRELLILLAAVTCLGSAWCAHAMGLSPVLGTFVAGLLLAESPFATQIRADVGMLRTLFLTLFFTSVGMLADLSWVAEHWPIVVCVAGAITVGKTLLVWAIVRILGQAHRYAVATGLCLAQLGEFSIVLANLAATQKVITEEQLQLVVAVTLVLLFSTPYLISVSVPAGCLVERLLRRRVAPDDEPVESEQQRGHVIVIGLGPAGQEVLAALRQVGVDTLGVELNPRTAATLRDSGENVHVGDATRWEILERAGLASAAAVVVTIPDHRAAAVVVRQVRATASRIHVIARARYHIYADELRAAGANVVIDEEQETGRLLGREIAAQLDVS